jgi:lipid II:glycine glycyltransferase (peptidoglycan interpeptide bridge formation enzyme)
VSASFFTSFNGMAYYTLSGHDAKALEMHAPSLVLWEMALRFKDEGIQRLNFGGCGVDALKESSSEHGVYIYKKAFGGAILECASGEKILRPAIRRAADLLRAAMR